MTLCRVLFCSPTVFVCGFVWHRFCRVATRLRCTFPSQACPPNSQRLCSQRAPLPTPNRRRATIVTSVPSHAAPTMPMYQLLQCATSTATLAAGCQPYPYPRCVCESVRPSKALASTKLCAPLRACQNGGYALPTSRCKLSPLPCRGCSTQPPNCGVTSTTVNMRPLKGTESFLPVGLRKVSGG